MERACPLSLKNSTGDSEPCKWERLSVPSSLSWGEEPVGEDRLVYLDLSTPTAAGREPLRGADFWEGRSKVIMGVVSLSPLGAGSPSSGDTLWESTSGSGWEGVCLRLLDLRTGPMASCLEEPCSCGRSFCTVPSELVRFLLWKNAVLSSSSTSSSESASMVMMWPMVGSWPLEAGMATLLLSAEASAFSGDWEWTSGPVSLVLCSSSTGSELWPSFCSSLLPSSRLVSWDGGGCSVMPGSGPRRSGADFCTKLASFGLVVEDSLGGSGAKSATDWEDFTGGGGNCDWGCCCVTKLSENTPVEGSHCQLQWYFHTAYLFSTLLHTCQLQFCRSYLSQNSHSNSFGS